MTKIGVYDIWDGAHFPTSKEAPVLMGHRNSKEPVFCRREMLVVVKGSLWKMGAICNRSFLFFFTVKKLRNIVENLAERTAHA